MEYHRLIHLIEVSELDKKKWFEASSRQVFNDRTLQFRTFSCDNYELLLNITKHTRGEKFTGNK